MTRLAILDIGTNSIHLVLAEVEPDFSYKILDRFKDMTRLGDGAFQHRRLTEPAMARAMDVIRQLSTLARNKGFDRIEAVATSAVREARNGGEFIDRIARETGLNVRVVTGEEEARLIYLGVRHSMDFSARPSLVLDVGGGSVELIAGNRERMLQGMSLKLGAIRLKDLYLHHDPPRKALFKAMRKMIKAELRPALARVQPRRLERLIGASGMIGNLAEVIHLRRTGRPLHQLNLASVSLKEVRAIEDRLLRSRLKARLSIPGLDPKRADTLLPASAVVRAVMEETGQKTMTISDQALREGLIYDFIERNRERLQAEHDIPNVRHRSVLHLAKRCLYPAVHSHHVAHLALQLFDQTRGLHRLGPREREWLEAAAILHDIGYVIHGKQHHKHAYYLITNSHLAGFTVDEIAMIANIARYHRRALPHMKHDAFRVLSSSKRRVLIVLGALLRMADALDRSYFSVIQQVTVKTGRRIAILCHTAGDAELELWAAQRRSDLFEKAFGRPVQFSTKRIRRS